MADGDPHRSGPCHVVLVGPMGVGKTTIGALVAEATGWSLVDSDHVIEALHGRTGSDIARDEGVARLHRIEAEVLDEALGFAPPSVIAGAASVADDAFLVDRLSTSAGVVVLLDCDPSVLAQRRQRGSHRRPVDHSVLEELTTRRRSTLQPIADLVLDVTDLGAEGAAAQIVDLIRSRHG